MKRFKGEWSVSVISDYPLSITNYGDMTFNKLSKALFENQKLTISSTTQKQKTQLQS